MNKLFSELSTVIANWFKWLVTIGIYFPLAACTLTVVGIVLKALWTIFIWAWDLFL